MNKSYTQIIAIRHGETDWNVQTRIQGSSDIPLNATGRWQAEQVGRALADVAIDEVHSSDLSRALDTAKAIAQHHQLTPQTHAAFQERHFGHFETLTWQEIETQWPDDHRHWKLRTPDWAPRMGESLIDFHDRVMPHSHALAEQQLGKTVVWVAHGGVLDLWHRAATGQHMQADRTWLIGNATINRLLWSDGRFQLVGWGDASHLEQGARDKTSA